jgi:aspartate racemase
MSQTGHTTTHIGIVACSAEGASLCYRTICANGPALLGAHAHPEVSLHGHSLAQYVDLLDRGDLAGVGALMLDSARRVAAIGADFVICPDNTIHQALPLVIDQSPVPWLHIAEVVAAEAARRGFLRIGVLGTRWLVDSEVYTASLATAGITAVRPAESDRDEIHRVIMDQLVPGDIRPDAFADVQRVIERLRDDGCDAVVLGCTEIPLIIDDSNSALPTLDSTRLLALAALRRATHHEVGHGA